MHAGRVDPNKRAEIDDDPWGAVPDERAQVGVLIQIP
jgi:hypothetical protein